MSYKTSYDEWIGYILDNPDAAESSIEKIPEKCEHEFIPLFSSVACKHCGVDKKSIEMNPLFKITVK